MRATEDDLRSLDLRCHDLLADVPLHDVWAVDLPGSAGRTMLDFREIVSAQDLTSVNAVVRALFRVRGWLGGLMGWNRPEPLRRDSFEDRLSTHDREASLVAPGTPEGPFSVLFVSHLESISEIHNATVHAFSVFALVPSVTGYRLYWAIYVRPVGNVTAWYMRLIDPFRRFIIYPAVLRQIERVWVRGVSG
jgi:hypothetical protein